MLLFGPQAERKEGVAPALLPCLHAYPDCAFDFVLYCLMEGYQVGDGNPKGKP